MKSKKEYIKIKAERWYLKYGGIIILLGGVFSIIKMPIDNITQLIIGCTTLFLGVTLVHIYLTSCLKLFYDTFTLRVLVFRRKVLLSEINHIQKRIHYTREGKCKSIFKVYLNSSKNVVIVSGLLFDTRLFEEYIKENCINVSVLSLHLKSAPSNLKIDSKKEARFSYRLWLSKRVLTDSLLVMIMLSLISLWPKWPTVTAFIGLFTPVCIYLIFYDFGDIFAEYEEGSFWEVLGFKTDYNLILLLFFAVTLFALCLFATQSNWNMIVVREQTNTEYYFLLILIIVIPWAVFGGATAVGTADPDFSGKTIEFVLGVIVFALFIPIARSFEWLFSISAVQQGLVIGLDEAKKSLIVETSHETIELKVSLLTYWTYNVSDHVKLIIHDGILGHRFICVV